MNDGLKMRIRARLQALNLTPNAASELAGLNREYLRELLKKEGRLPNWRTFSKLSAALKCDANWLASGQGAAPDGSGADENLVADLASALPHMTEEESEDFRALLKGIAARGRLKSAAK